MLSSVQREILNISSATLKYPDLGTVRCLGQADSEALASPDRHLPARDYATHRCADLGLLARCKRSPLHRTPTSGKWMMPGEYFLAEILKD